MGTPVIDIGLCTQCMGCVSICPVVFQYNDACNFIEVLSLPEYPVNDVNEAIKFCPEDCIAWENNLQL